ncbi:hypothetical protein HKBW3S43_00108 [Candidatus Hakubella thermalkaliphila]|uniref:Uncharacterized protein n=1 Tax=Candidatus Hakubella thermalkaliphila TaxID=2754717 RepID=A0A6V8P4Z2_9ACTN|nr:hypothetical protein [Candidatus Hakubella thermalkaliphila]MBT9169665.1 hypothetical protein [Bacillota bacterium]GFP24684.1 hypothetical protein HKBW3S25_00121 [Candidatus Hakubella thermalkaliphila]GFP27695.1 hypothetical protein HKBW3S33_01105 [Candidatus Hakubella thermalkaliphila]GFP34315.1 hypothetical protein HKBW3S43_00108 [Candidatus Hakubella thermalkaliphila]GFP43426.1 hypothetical protein HKBW3C_02556 [Candidatus Hakubella thermalkaliphila]
MSSKPRTIKLRKDTPFGEELLPQQTLLHIYFQDNYQNDFKWTPRWKDMLTIFYKAWEVEEKNNPAGIWDEEFKKMEKEISVIKEYRLPVKIKCGE